jgi:hypothetical protein
VWLGVANEYSERAIDCLRAFSRIYPTEYIEVFDNADPLLATAHREAAHFRLQASLHKYSKLLSDPDNHIARSITAYELSVYHFFNRPYWRRLWIIQELTNGRAGMSIVCGSQVTQWRCICDAAFVYTANLDVT